LDVEFDKAKTGVIRWQKTIGSQRDSQLPYLNTFKGVIHMKKIVLGMILIFFLSISTSRVYGYYEDSQTNYLSETETSLKIIDKMRSNDGMDLVPTGVILGINDTEQIVFTYKVFVQEGVEFSYSVENILINNEILSEDLNGLFVFEYEVIKLNTETLQVNLIEDIQGSYYEVSVTLSMNLPTYEQYNVIAGQQLAFEFTVETIENVL